MTEPGSRVAGGTPSDDPSGSKPRYSTRRRRRWPWAVAAVILIALLGFGGWLGFRVLTVKSELETSLAQVSAVQAGGDVTDGLRAVAQHSSAAVAATRDPIWGLSEKLPWVGDNLRAVRVASESAKLLSADLAVPVLDALGQDGDTPLLGRVVPVMSAAAPLAATLTAELASVGQSPALIGQVRDGVQKVAEVMNTATPVLELMPKMLGADGPRNYLLVAQNNAESLALGGSAASETLIKVAQNGKVEIAAQADSGDYNNGKAVDVRIDKSAIDLYNDHLITHVNTTVGRPDFPTAARLIKAFWQRDIHNDRIDGVASIDPLALAEVLKATGPITVPGWKEVTSENVVRLVLSEAYAVSTDPNVSDDLFKSLAIQVFDKVTSGKFDLKKMLSAVTAGIDRGSIMFWSADEAIQSKVATMQLGGILPTNNADQTVIGVYFRDGSMGSKIDYYLKSSATLKSACSADGKTTYTATVKLNLDLSQKVADKLPAYVVSGKWGSKKFRTQVFIYGPPGTKVTDVKLDRSKGDWKWRPAGMTDLGRPVASFMTIQTPGSSNTVEAVFEGAGEFGPLQARTTPMVNPTKVTVADARCGAK